MPKQKMKTHKGTAKRVKKTPNKFMRNRANDTHFLEKQRGGRQRAIEKKAEIVGKIRKKIKRALGV